MKNLKNEGSIEEIVTENAEFKGKNESSAVRKKAKFTIRLLPETLNAVNTNYSLDCSNTRSEFIEHAIEFYISYLYTKGATQYISPTIKTIMDSSIKNTEQRLSRNLFKIAVELGKLSHMIAAVNEIDEETLHDLHAMCVDEVRRINGIIQYEKAVKFQQEE